MELEKMSNSELMTYLLMSRDNLISIRRAMQDNEGLDLEELFQTEEKTYTTYLKEVYRRMNYGPKHY